MRLQLSPPASEQVLDGSDDGEKRLRSHE